jgi:hypothetical protein
LNDYQGLMDYSKEQEIKRIQEMIRKLEAEQAGEASYEQAADLSSIASTDPQPIVPDSPSDAPAFDTAMSLSDLEGPVTPAPAADVPAKHAAPAPAQAVETTLPATEPAPTPAAEQPVAPVESASPVTETASVQPADKAASEQPAKPAVQNAAPAEAQPAETAQAVAKTEDATSADEAKTKDGKKKKKRRKLRLSKGTIFIAVLAECMLLIIAIFVFTHSVSLNSDDDVVYSDPNQVDVITCADGTLNVNNVSVSVPPENATYNISYTWGRKDEDYPTVPHSVTSSYYGKDGNLMYDISLYRESLTKPADIPQGKDASNWFTDWATDDSETNLHKPMDSGSIHGFLVSSVEDIEEGATGTTYGSTSYYFALQDEEGLSIYVLESILYDKASLEAYRKVMDDCIKSIKVSQKTV